MALASLSFETLQPTTIQRSTIAQHKQTITKMDVDEDDDFYAPEANVAENKEEQNEAQPPTQPEQDEDLEEGEEEDEAVSEGSDSVCSRSYVCREHVLMSCRI